MSDIAKRIADDLLHNGAGTEASRLVLMVEHPDAPPLDIGGWSKKAVEDRIDAHLPQWQAIESREPEYGQRVLIFSPCYDAGDPMRYRIVSWVTRMTDATHWLSFDALPSLPTSEEKLNAKV